MPFTPTLPWELTHYRPGLMHVHTPHPAAAFAMSFFRAKCPLIVTHHSDILGRRSLHGAVRPFIRQLMLRADRIIVTSRRYLDTSPELRDYRHKCVVIGLGIEREAFAAPDHNKVAAIRRELGPDVILAVGRLVAYKGLEYAIRAMSQVDGKLAIIGTGPLEIELRELTISLGLLDKVQFLGKVTEIAPYYKAAKVFVLPSISRAEAFGIVQLEAMAAGLPVVNTDVESGVPEVSLNGCTGLTVPPRDSKALATALQFLLSNEHQRLKMGDAARSRADCEYNVEKMVSKTAEVYEAALTLRTRRSVVDALQGGSRYSRSD
jgi:rhamnosyl/mannosyltransferase